MQTKRIRKIKESDIDLLGHVNYAVYIEEMTRARNEWLAVLIGPLEEVTERGLAYPLVQLDLSYIKETLLGDELMVLTEPNEVGNKSFSLKQKIFNKEQALVAEGIATHVMFELEHRNSIPVVPEIRNVFEKVEEEKGILQEKISLT